MPVLRCRRHYARPIESVRTSGELKKIVSIVMSIPASNAYPERAFSHMNSVWSKGLAARPGTEWLSTW
jgi:hypothetical protein